jgi:hypothetical protein
MTGYVDISLTGSDGLNIGYAAYRAFFKGGMISWISISKGATTWALTPTGTGTS